MSVYYDRIINRLHRAAERGDAEAAGRLGWIYFNGAKPRETRVVCGRLRSIRDPYQDFRKAARWLRRAVGMGNVDSMHGFAICLLDGRGIQAQKDEGLRWLRIAAARGVPSAQYHLGLVLSEGRYGQELNCRRAQDWFKKATKSDDIELATNAAEKVWQMYFDGKGVRQNYRAARIWIKKLLALAMDETSIEAMIEMYQRGLGVRANPKQVAVWEERLRAF